ncbi:Hypothetical protein PHPALM_323 [Phytophthora palmivora]|uniref:Uncharacterized protein n=1 Tax=Phytophthora palmivora TaxID=4796 RepID=A0A2P4YV43_9STRA|nr:Hypothetical protein PHPALM_323 [Phytophthora palmivora]
MALVGVLTQTPDDDTRVPRPRARRENDGRCETHHRSPIPDSIRRLISINRRGQEPCLLNVTGLPCSGGVAERCGNPRRMHKWPDALPTRLQEWIDRTCMTIAVADCAVRKAARFFHGSTARLSRIIHQVLHEICVQTTSTAAVPPETLECQIDTAGTCAIRDRMATIQSATPIYTVTADYTVRADHTAAHGHTARVGYTIDTTSVCPVKYRPSSHEAVGVEAAPMCVAGSSSTIPEPADPARRQREPVKVGYSSIQTDSSTQPKRLRPVVSPNVAAQMHQFHPQDANGNALQDYTEAGVVASSRVVSSIQTRGRWAGISAEFPIATCTLRTCSPFKFIAGGICGVDKGETSSDYRPNKNMVPAVIDELCKDYRQLDQLKEIVLNGVEVRLRATPPRQTLCPPNHGSARDRTNVLRKNIRKEQDAWRCLVLDMDLLERWPEIVINPFGVVDKGNEDATSSGRTIHDLSFPEGSSINDCTDQDSITKPDYRHYDAVVTDILRAKYNHRGAEIHVMAGDVACAFRNISIHSTSVYLCTGLIEEENALVIELSAPFGWTGSPGFYDIFGGAISHVYGDHMNTICPTGVFNYHWGDDHIDRKGSLSPLCMVAVLGGDAINDMKFTGWSTGQHVLGLQFDSAAGRVSMPATKILKARRIVVDAYSSSTLSHKMYRSLKGKLRHVATCIRAACLFFQRLRLRENELHRFQRVPMTEDMKQDLLWWWHVLHTHHLDGVSLEYFNMLPVPYVVIEMDDTDFRLCALDISAHEALTYQFTAPEGTLTRNFKNGEANGFDINYRELLSCQFTVQIWARAGLPTFHTTVGRSTYISASTTPQLSLGKTIYRRAILVLKKSFQLRFSASHIAGVDNTRGDAGFRIAASASFATRFASLTRDWLQVSPTVDIQGLNQIWHLIFALTPLSTPRMTNTAER